jgi:hypothetical protein
VTTAGSKRSRTTEKAQGESAKKAVRADHAHLCAMVINGKTYLCKIDPATGICDQNQCVPAADKNGAIRALVAGGQFKGAAPPKANRKSLMGLKGEGLRPTKSAGVDQGLRQACLSVANRTSQFRRQNQILIGQLGALDLDRTANSFPKTVSGAMKVAEQSRMALIRAFADFDEKCGSLEAAATKAAES